MTTDEWMDRENVRQADRQTDRHTHEYNSARWKRMKSCYLGQHGWILLHCAKWNKSDKEWDIPYDFSYMWSLKQTKPSSDGWLPEVVGDVGKWVNSCSVS